MASTCEVCTTEPSKYKCPVCALTSCSLGCSQSHKIYCTPKTEAETETETEPRVQSEAQDQTEEPGDSKPDESKINIPALRNHLANNPSLRAQIRDIYRCTLEEEWVEIDPETPSQAYRGRGRDRGRGRGRGRDRGKPRSRGPWTPEKGFRRGLGRVRKIRQRIEEENKADEGGIGGFARVLLEGR